VISFGPETYVGTALISRPRHYRDLHKYLILLFLLAGFANPQIDAK
jgi:hypothetical protein